MKPTTSLAVNPQIFDLLPHLHLLLARLLPPQPTPDPLNPLAPPTGNSVSNIKHEPLEIQNLAREASALRVRIQKARQAVREVEDGDRTIEEQEEEIKELEGVVEGLKGVLKGLGAVDNGGKVSNEGGDIVMGT